MKGVWCVMYAVLCVNKPADYYFVINISNFNPTTALPEHRTTALPHHSFDFSKFHPPPHHFIVVYYLTILVFIRISIQPPLFRSTAPPHHLTAIGPCIIFQRPGQQLLVSTTLLVQLNLLMCLEEIRMCIPSC